MRFSETTASDAADAVRVAFSGLEKESFVLILLEASSTQPIVNLQKIDTESFGNSKD